MSDSNDTSKSGGGDSSASVAPDHQLELDPGDEWFDSTERAKARLETLRWISFSAFLLILGYVAIYSHFQEPDGRETISRGVLFPILTVVFGAAFYSYVRAFTAVRSGRIAFQERREQLARQNVYEALEEVEASMDLPALLKLNRKQIDEYHLLTKNQATSAYLNSQVAMCVGFAVLVAGVLVATLASNTTTQIASASLAAVGAGLSGYVSRTFIRAYEKTLSQLNYFFEQPLLDSYVLTAERLVQQMSSKRRDDSYARLIDGIFETAVYRRDSITKSKRVPPLSSRGDDA